MLISAVILPASVFARADSWLFPNGEAFNASNDYTIEFANDLATLKPNIFVPEVEGDIADAFDAAVYDFDGDGDQDIYASSVSGFNQYYTNNGNKTFTASTLPGDIELQQTDNLTLGDFNGDEEMDIYVGNINDFEGNFILLGDGNGGFTKSEQAVGSDDTLDSAAADFDNDGDLDIVATSSLNQTDKIYINQGGVQEGLEGIFIESALDAVTNQYSQGVATGDFNGDTIPDLYIGTMSGGSQNKLFLGDGDGTFTPANIAGDTSEVRSVAIGDIDNDGDNDIYVGVYGEPNFFWINDGDANFTQYFVPGDHEFTLSVYLEDIDGDADLDARSVGLNGPNTILINDGTGTFTLSDPIPNDTSAWNTMYADFDNNGDLDILNLNTLTIFYQGYDYRSPYIELKDSLMFGTTMNSFSEVTSINSEGTTTYQVSTDNGQTWYYYDDGAWQLADATDGTETSTALAIGLNISTLDTNGGQFLWRAYFNSNGAERVELESVTVDSTAFDHDIQITGSTNNGQWTQNSTNQLDIEISCLGVEDCVGIDTEVYSVIEDSREVSITPETEDCITDNVCFSMMPVEGYVLTNTVQDGDFSMQMPLGTLWSDSACGANPEELEYGIFLDVAGFSPTLGSDYCVYLEDDDTYMNINFSEYDFGDGLATYQRSGEFATLVPAEVSSPLYATDLQNPIEIATMEGGTTQTISFNITNSAEIGSEYKFYAKTSLPFAPDVNEDSELSTVTIIEQAIENNGGGGGSSGSGSRSNRSVTSAGITYSDEVAKVMAEKIVTENPDGPANKCEALMMISRAFNWQVPTSTTSKYTDVPSWCVSLAAYGTTRGIVEGRTVSTLGLETPVTRNEVATMIHRELKKQSYKFTSTQIPTFSDTLTPWASEAILALAAEGIIKGFSDGTFGGEKNILKKDLGVMLLRAKESL